MSTTSSASALNTPPWMGVMGLGRCVPKCEGDVVGGPVGEAMVDVDMVEPSVVIG